MSRKDNNKYKILIVDDLPKNLMVLGNNLMQENYQVAYARNGSDAVSMSLENDFDLILLDIMMPGMDGYETCDLILGNPKTAHIPLIFITARNDYDSIVKGFEMGAKDYVTKPFNSKELLERVRTHLELKSKREELEHLNQDLEKIVAERTQQLKLANEKIKQLDAAKSSFLGIISHEIRTPLNGIFGSIEMFKSMHESEDDLEILEMMSDSAERLLSFSELSTLIAELNVDQYEITKETVQLNELVQQVCNHINNRLNDGHQVRFHLKDSSEDLVLMAELKLIEKVIHDVIDNSIKFNHEEVNVHIDFKKDQDFIELAIKDDGVGFPEHVLPGLFEVFQANSEEYVEGKGLNLAAAKLILNAHNGQIKAGNQHEGGAEVFIRIPLK